MKSKLFALCALFVCLFTLVSYSEVEAKCHRKKVSVSSFSVNLGLGGLFAPTPCYTYREPVVVREPIVVREPVVVREYYPSPYYVSYPQPVYQEVYVRQAPPAYYYFR